MLHIWKIKKKVFFNKLFWWNYNYRLIRTRQEQRKRKRCTRKSRFKVCVRARKDYTYGIRPITSSNISNEKYDIRRGYKFFSIQLFLRYKKRILYFKNRYTNFYKFYHKLYPENLRTDLLEFYDHKENKLV